MNNNVFFIIQLTLSIAAGIGFGIWIKPHLSKALTRLTPMTQRLGEGFLKQLRMRTLILGGLLAMLTALAVFIGLQELAGGFGTKQSTRQQLPRPTALELAAPNLPPDETVPNLPTPINEQTEAAAAELPQRTAPRVGNVVRIYLQVESFQVPENARKGLTNWQRRYANAICIEVPGETVPYKILLGPFESLEAARAFRDKAGLKGFPLEK